MVEVGSPSSALPSHWRQWAVVADDGGGAFVNSNEYHFVTRWTVTGTCEEVADILADPRDLVRWWPSVYLDVDVIQPGRTDGVGRVIDLWTKGWLPYTLRWRFTTTENNGAAGMALTAQGDFVGEGRWAFFQDGTVVHAEYDWRITAEKPMLKRLTWLLRPAFSANHRWAMKKGEESLKLELVRRRAGEPRNGGVLKPPGPTFPWFIRRGKRR